MDNAVLNNEFVAAKTGDITVYNYNDEIREYISTSAEYPAVGVGIPAHSCLDAPGTYKAGYTICRPTSLNLWEYVLDRRGEIVYSTETGDSREVTVSGDHPEKTTTIAPLTPYGKWDDERWVMDIKARHNTAADAAELQYQLLINDTTPSIVLIQLEL